MKNHARGWVEEEAIDEFSFKERYQTFQSYGYALNPSVGVLPVTSDYIGNADAAQKMGGEYPFFSSFSFFYLLPFLLSLPCIDLSLISLPFNRCVCLRYATTKTSPRRGWPCFNRCIRRNRSSREHSDSFQSCAGCLSRWGGWVN